jgi:iron complex outermembrane receptor protein
VGKNEQQENFWLWNLTASYQIHSNFRIFARGENLLAQKYEVIAGFPMPRTTFMSGLQISF